MVDWVDVKNTAWRFEVSEEIVEAEATKIERNTSLEFEIKRKRRDREMISFLQAAHDREAQRSTCQWVVGIRGYSDDGDPMEELCGQGPFHTWGEMEAHIRMHLIINSKNERNIRQVLKDSDSLLVPKEDVSAKVKLTDEDRETILARLGMFIPKKLKSPDAHSGDE
jgi:hypothetical protein